MTHRHRHPQHRVIEDDGPVVRFYEPEPEVAARQADAISGRVSRSLAALGRRPDARHVDRLDRAAMLELADTVEKKPARRAHAEEIAPIVELVTVKPAGAGSLSRSHKLRITDLASSAFDIAIAIALFVAMGGVG